MSPIGRYVALVVFIIVSLSRDPVPRPAVDRDVLCLADRSALHPFRDPPRVRSRYFNLEHQKQVHLHPSRICPRQVLHPTGLQREQASAHSESQRHDGHVGQEQRHGQCSPERQADTGPVQSQVPVPVGLLERGALLRRIQTVRLCSLAAPPRPTNVILGVSPTSLTVQSSLG